ncbi:HET-domain-containing protein [Xylariaceae sp. FL1651]|nr:HET-domain-containing protein [Xylariaceae sp. FL1651]
MRLINIHTLSFETVDQVKRQTKAETVPYVIISHRWLDDEVVFADMENDSAGFLKQCQDPSWSKAQSAAKLLGARDKAYAWSTQRHRNEKNLPLVNHFWLDNVCINKTDTVELSESINSMFRWYKEATVCFVYMNDCREGDMSLFGKSEWFQRGWTLQELVAPEACEFYDRDWKYIGSRNTLSSEIAQRTSISRHTLSLSSKSGMSKLSSESVGHRMSWAAQRQTTKGEDLAYCLMGLFGVNMPALYGEGAERAFRRLQEEILKYSDDHSLFAWVDDKATDGGKSSGLLAPRPSCFHTTGKYAYGEALKNIDAHESEPYNLTNKGLSISLRMFQQGGDVYVASLECLVDHEHCVGIFLRRISERSNVYVRIYPQKLCKVKIGQQGNPQRIFVRQTLDF